MNWDAVLLAESLKQLPAEVKLKRHSVWQVFSFQRRPDSFSGIHLAVFHMIWLGRALCQCPLGMPALDTHKGCAPRGISCYCLYVQDKSSALGDFLYILHIQSVR